MVGQKIKNWQANDHYTKKHYQAWLAYQKADYDKAHKVFKQLIETQSKKIKYLNQVRPSNYRGRLVDVVDQLNANLAYYLAIEVILLEQSVNSNNVSKVLNQLFNQQLLKELNLPLNKSNWKHARQWAELLVLNISARSELMSIDFKRYNLIAKDSLEAFKNNYHQLQLDLLEAKFPDIRQMSIENRSLAAQHAHYLAQYNQISKPAYYTYYKKYFAYKLCAKFESLDHIKQALSQAKKFIKDHCPIDFDTRKEQEDFEIYVRQTLNNQQFMSKFHDRITNNLSLVDKLRDSGYYTPQQYMALKKWLQFSLEFKQFILSGFQNSTTQSLSFFLKTKIGQLPKINNKDPKLIENRPEVAQVATLINNTKNFRQALDTATASTLPNDSKNLEAILVLYRKHQMDKKAAIKHLSEVTEEESFKLMSSISNQVSHGI